MHYSFEKIFIITSLTFASLSALFSLQRFLFEYCALNSKAHVVRQNGRCVKRSEMADTHYDTGIRPGGFALLRGLSRAVIS